MPARTLRFGVEPGDRRDGAAVDDEERRTVFLVQPKLRGGKDLVAKALKATFFEAVLNSPKRVRLGGAAGEAGPYWDENITGAQPARKFNLGRLVNRLLHHCHIVNIRGKRYRIG